MEDTNLGFGLTIIALLLVLVGLGFQSGRKYEQRVWEKLLPVQMEKLCLQCAGVTR